MTGNQVTAQMVSGVKSASNVAVQVTVRRTISKTFSKIFPSATSFVTISATAVAELAGGGAQPCLVALMGGSTGSTAGAGITVTGSGEVTTHNCSIRSNAGISMTGSASLDVASVYAGGTITTTGSASIIGPQFANAGQIPDPYGTYAPLQNAFASLSSGGSSQNIVGSTTATLSPGTYSKISVGGSAKVTLNPGLYVVNGDVSFTGSATVNGHGITIISSGKLSSTGSTSLSLTAPPKTATSGVPGILFASKGLRRNNRIGGVGIGLRPVLAWLDD